jgi:hypothetical protein
MRSTILISSLAAVTLILVVISCRNSEARTGGEKESMTTEDLVKRGSYLVNAIGCDDCHSPKVMGPDGPEIIESLRFSGYPADRAVAKPDSIALKKGWLLFSGDLTSFAGPWGISFAANISSDPTGIGNWTLEQFTRAIREGKLKGLKESRPLLPPMPWFAYKNLSDEDLSAIFAYLKSTKPVSNRVPEPRSPNEINH